MDNDLTRPYSMQDLTCHLLEGKLPSKGVGGVSVWLIEVTVLMSLRLE